MPYIKQERRVCFQRVLTEATYSMDKESNAGDFNYLITNLCLEYVNAKGESYQAYNDLLGALEGCKLELYRRMIAEYEDGAIKRNGDL